MLGNVIVIAKGTGREFVTGTHHANNSQQQEHNSDDAVHEARLPSFCNVSCTQPCVCLFREEQSTCRGSVICLLIMPNNSLQQEDQLDEAVL